MTDTRCGYVALIGRPNAGKSTLLNQILGSKLAITSAKPQTTRNRIVGVHNAEGMQAILLDTPGIHKPWTELNKVMVDAAMGALDEVDVVCWVCDMTLLARRVEEDQPVLDEVADEIADRLVAAGKTIVVVANKIDVVPKPLLLPVMAALSERLEGSTLIPVSALTGDGVPELLAEIAQHLPVHPPLFPTDTWAQVTERFLAAEIIREKIFHLTEQEVPYSTFVEIEKFDEEQRETESLVKIYARILVERSSQKGIVIGRGGEMLKRIGTLARKELQGVLGCRVYLNLHVSVERDWTKTRRGLRKVGFEGT